MELTRQLVVEYGYLAVFIGTFLEGEVVLVCAGFAAQQGLLSAPLVAGVAACGAYSGHIAFFQLGRWKGRGWLFDHPRLGKHAQKADRIITGYGWSSLFILQYLYGARLAGAPLFGISSFTWPRFLVLQAVNCMTWAMLVTGVGYLLGSSLEQAKGRLALISAVVVVVILMVTWAVVRRRRTGL